MKKERISKDELKEMMALVPDSIKRSTKLNGNAKKLLALLIQWSEEDGCFLSLSDIKKYLGWNSEQVVRARKKLIREGILEEYNKGTKHGEASTYKLKDEFIISTNLNSDRKGSNTEVVTGSNRVVTGSNTKVVTGGSQGSHTKVVTGGHTINKLEGGSNTSYSTENNQVRHIDNDNKCDPNTIQYKSIQNNTIKDNTIEERNNKKRIIESLELEGMEELKSLLGELLSCGGNVIIGKVEIKNVTINNYNSNSTNNDLKIEGSEDINDMDGSPLGESVSHEEKDVNETLNDSSNLSTVEEGIEETIEDNTSIDVSNNAGNNAVIEDNYSNDSLPIQATEKPLESKYSFDKMKRKIEKMSIKINDDEIPDSSKIGKALFYISQHCHRDDNGDLDNYLMENINFKGRTENEIRIILTNAYEYFNNLSDNASNNAGNNAIIEDNSSNDSLPIQASEKTSESKFEDNSLIDMVEEGPIDLDKICKDFFYNDSSATQPPKLDFKEIEEIFKTDSSNIPTDEEAIEGTVEKPFESNCERDHIKNEIDEMISNIEVSTTVSHNIGLILSYIFENVEEGNREEYEEYLFESLRNNKRFVEKAESLFFIFGNLEKIFMESREQLKDILQEKAEYVAAIA